MKAHELISDSMTFDYGDARANLLHARLLLAYLADHVYTAELNSGERISDATAFKIWLHELAEAAREMAASVNGAPLSQRLELSATPKISPMPQRRWDEFCPDCGHIHADDGECGFPQGGNRKCRCERSVSA